MRWDAVFIKSGSLASAACHAVLTQGAAEVGHYFNWVCLHLLIKQEQCPLRYIFPQNYEIMQEDKGKCKTTQSLIKMLHKKELY